MKHFETKKLFCYGYNFMKRVSDGVVLYHTRTPIGSILEELNDVTLSHPDVTKAVLDQALKDKSFSEIKKD